MGLRAVVKYIDYRLKRDTEQSLFEQWVAESLSTIAAGMRTKDRFSYTEQRERVWGRVKPKDTRSAEQIIADTMRRHGIKIRRKPKE